MDYNISAFAKLTGVSERTLRYYHQRHLLHPRVAANGYRTFTSADADAMQLIRFYTATGFTLEETATLLHADRVQRLAALRHQREELTRQQRALSTLIAQVDATIANQEEDNMTDSEKFAAFKAQKLSENDHEYGQEITEKWGTDAKAQSDQHFAGLSKAQYQRSEVLADQLVVALHEAVVNGAPTDGVLAERVCALHQQWLTIMWGKYTPKMHRGLVDMYAADPRFPAHYDKLAGAGAGDFLTAAVRQFA